MGSNLSLLTFKLHILEPWVAISRHFPKANFILGHPVYKIKLFLAQKCKKIFLDAIASLATWHDCQSQILKPLKLEGSLVGSLMKSC